MSFFKAFRALVKQKPTATIEASGTIPQTIVDLAFALDRAGIKNTRIIPFQGNMRFYDGTYQDPCVSMYFSQENIKMTKHFSDILTTVHKSWFQCGGIICDFNGMQQIIEHCNKIHKSSKICKIM